MQCAQVKSISSLSTLLLRALREQNDCCPLTLHHIYYTPYIYIYIYIYILHTKYIYIYILHTIYIYAKILSEEFKMKNLDSIIFFIFCVFLWLAGFVTRRTYIQHQHIISINLLLCGVMYYLSCSFRLTSELEFRHWMWK